MSERMRQKNGTEMVEMEEQNKKKTKRNIEKEIYGGGTKEKR